jgi:hypothetical protein
VLDNLSESMIVDSPAGARLRTFGEFATEYQESSSTLRRAFDETKHLLHAFHPQEKPVMWRLLLLQALIHRALLRPRGAPVQLDDLISEKDLKAFDWRQKSESGVTHTDAVAVPMNAALRHFRVRLEDVSEPFKVYEVRATA